MHRRELLRGGLAAALSATLGACTRATAPKPDHIAGDIVDHEYAIGHLLRDGGIPPTSGPVREARILVIGGGVAGLSTCWRLQRAGVQDVELLELADEVGGTSRGGTINGLAHPWGAHYLPVPRVDQRALAALLFDLDIATGARDDGRLDVPMRYRVRAPQERVYALGYWEEGLWVQTAETERDRDESARFDALVRELAAPDDSGRPFELPVASSSKIRRGLDGEDAKTWANRHGLSGERMRWYLEYATRDDFGARLEDTSAWALLHYFAARLTRDGEGAEFLTWPEGNAWLVERMRAALECELHTGKLVTRVRPVDAKVELDVFDVHAGRATTWRADQVVLALPQFVNARLLTDDPARDARGSFRYGPWVVANLHLSEVPPTRGFPLAWDNVLYHSDSLGYVDATHQLDRIERDTVWTWYLPVTDTDERFARQSVFERTWEEWRDIVLRDLGGAHPGLVDVVTRLDVRRWGHAMVKPTTGFLWGANRAAAARSIGRVHFANADLSGMALFEEAQWQGTRAAEAVCTSLGVEFEALA